MPRITVLSSGWRAVQVAAICSAPWISGCAATAPQTPAVSYSDNPPRVMPHADVVPAVAASGPTVTPQIAPASQPAEPLAVLAFPTGNRDTSVVLLEQISPAEARVGVPYAYEVRVTNLTKLPITGVVLDQQIPGDFKLTGTSIGASTPSKATTQQSPAAETHLRLEVGELAPRESRTVQVNGIPSHAGAFDTSLSVQYNPPALRTHVSVVAPLLKVVAQASAESDVCQDVVYHYTVSNTGSGTAHDVLLQEKLPEGLISAEGGGSVSIAVGDLTPGESKEFTTRLRALRAGKYVTSAIVTSSDAPQAQAGQLSTVVLAPRLAITVSGPRESYFGQPLTYQVAVTNRGGAPAARARLKLGSTPGHAKFVGAEASDGTALKAMPDSAEQEIGTIAPGQTRTATIHFHPQQGGPVTVDATALANCAEPVAASTSTKVVTVAATALMVTHDPEPVAIGSNVVYHITVTNKGTAPDGNVVVAAALPGSTQFVRASGGTAAKAEGQTVRFTPIATLEPGKSVSWQIEAKAVRQDDAQLLASMTSDSNPKPVARLESTTLFGLQTGTVTGTSESGPSTTSAPATQPEQLNK